MALELVNIGRERVPEAVQLLREVYKPDQDAFFLTSEFIEWAWFPPLCNKSRAFGMERDGRLVSFGYVIPWYYERTRAYQLACWASRSSGAGVALFRAVRRHLGATHFTIGGSVDTIRIMPYLADYHQLGNLTKWHCSASRTKQSERRVRGWSLQPLFAAFNTGSAHRLSLVRNMAWLRYMERCPATKISSFQLLRHSEAVGHVVIARRGSEIRLLDIASITPRVLTISVVRDLLCTALPQHFLAMDHVDSGVFDMAGFTNCGEEVVYAAPKPEQSLELNMLVGEAGWLPSKLMWDGIV
jgi:hypothetical protein